MVLSVGVDVGNSDTKSENTSTPSGFSSRGLLPYGADDYIRYGGTYYIPDAEERFPYKKDKTTDQNMFILTLFAIAKEAVFEITNDLGAKTREEVQAKIDAISRVDLGVGLPPAHCPVLGGKTVEYYRERFGEGASFEYRGYQFNLKLGACRFFPQDWAAIVTHMPNSEESIARKYTSYYAVDIGGYTVDVVPIMNRRPAATRCTSIEKGVLMLHAELSKVLEQDYGKTVRPDIIEAVIRGDETILPAQAKERILRGTREWSDDMIRMLGEAGVLFDSYPVVFLGGGVETFKDHIKANPAVQVCEFIFGANVNARGYARLMRLAREQEAGGQSAR